MPLDAKDRPRAGRASGKAPGADDPEARRPAGRDADPSGYGGRFEPPVQPREAEGFGGRRRVEREVRVSKPRAWLLLTLLVCLPPAALAADAPPYSEKVVVSAALVPEDETATGSASTVITRARIEETGAVTVLEAESLEDGHCNWVPRPRRADHGARASRVAVSSSGTRAALMTTFSEKGASAAKGPPGRTARSVRRSHARGF